MVPTKSRQWFRLLHDMLMYFNLCICSWTRTTSRMGSCRPISGSARHGISYLQVNPCWHCWHLPKHGKCLKYSMDLWKSWPSKGSNKSKREINQQYMGHVTKLWPSCYMALLSTRQPQFRDLTHMINIIEELKEKQKNYCLMMHLSFRTAIKHWIGQWKMFSLHCIVYILVDVSGTWMGRLRSSENLLFSCSRSTPSSVVTMRWRRSPWPMSWCHAEHALTMRQCCER